RGGNVYFDVSSYRPYGELSGRDPDELVEGTRVEVRSDKDDPRDFAVWKEAEAGHIMRWNSPWGPGFPGWHLECTVMSTKYLGDEFDIHGGGLDLVFPHHECELAQGRAAGKPFARYWLHWNMITLGGEKMAKSKDHFVTLEALFAQHDPIAVRFHLLGSHYRSVSDFSDESLVASAQGLRRLRETYDAVKEELARQSQPAAGRDGRSELGESFSAARAAFGAAMNDDLNTPRALAALFEASREVRKSLDDSASPAYLEGAAALFEDLLAGVLGVPLVSSSTARGADEVLGQLVELLLEQRHQARVRRDFKAADELRARLEAIGVVVEDGPDGSRWRLVSA